jgi:hypothetical protein
MNYCIITKSKNTDLFRSILEDITALDLKEISLKNAKTGIFVLSEGSVPIWTNSFSKAISDLLLSERFTDIQECWEHGEIPIAMLPKSGTPLLATWRGKVLCPKDFEDVVPTSETVKTKNFVIQEIMDYVPFQGYIRPTRKHVFVKKDTKLSMQKRQEISFVKDI